MFLEVLAVLVKYRVKSLIIYVDVVFLFLNDPKKMILDPMFKSICGFSCFDVSWNVIPQFRAHIWQSTLSHIEWSKRLLQFMFSTTCGIAVIYAFIYIRWVSRCYVIAELICAHTNTLFKSFFSWQPFNPFEFVNSYVSSIS